MANNPSDGAGTKPSLGTKSFEMGTARPGDRARVGAHGGPEAGMPARPASSRSGRPPATPGSAGSAPRVARPGGAEKATGKTVPAKSRVR